MFVYGYRLGLQHMASIYLRLMARGEVGECCEGCPLVEELEHLLALSIELEIEQLEAELGYYLD